MKYLPIRPAHLLGVLAALGIQASAPAAGAEENPIKIAVVNLEQVVAQSAHGKALQERLAKFQQMVQAELKEQAASIEFLRGKFEAGAKTLEPLELDDLQHAYEQAKSDLRQYQDRMQREGQQLQTEGLQKIEAALAPVFEKIRDEQGYDLILNNTPGVVIMVGERIEITQLVIARANALAKDGGR